MLKIGSSLKGGAVSVGTASEREGKEGKQKIHLPVCVVSGCAQ